MKRLFLVPVAVLIGFSFAGCGASEEGTTDPSGTKTKDYTSIQEREFQNADEYYDYGDFDRIKVIHLSDGTKCVLYHVGNGDSDDSGGGITCNWPQPTQSPSSLSTP